MLRRLDKRGQILFTDIAAPNFNSERETGRTYESLMANIHGRMPDGTIIDGVEVFRQLYGRVGLRALMPLTQLPGIREGLDVLYALFAKNRLRLTGRCPSDGACRLEAQEGPESG